MFLKMEEINYLIKNTPGVKKEWPRTKTGFAERDVISMGSNVF